MTPTELEAYETAKDLCEHSSVEGWIYTSLSPKMNGTGQIRSGFDVLANLTVLPPEIRSLKKCSVLELRATRIQDLTPLLHLDALKCVHFDGIPACSEDPRLAEISQIADGSVRTIALKELLASRATVEPPAPNEGGPKFHVPDAGVIELIDPPIGKSDDVDQGELLDECRRKADELSQIVDTAVNVAPSLPSVVHRYIEQVSKNAGEVGARHIWSIANSLEAAMEIHQHSIEHNRSSDELPPSVSAKLSDLVQTHRVWFLGHPGARLVEERSTRHTRGTNPAFRRGIALDVVRAAESSDAVANEATIPALENEKASYSDGPAGIAALGELEDWAWNFVASVSRKLWHVLKEPPGGFVVQSIAGYYLVEFVVLNEASLRLFAMNVMSQGPLWWEALMEMVNRARHRYMQSQPN